MQFFLNGFRQGDPDLAPAAGDGAQPPLRDGSELDVLIVGSGPAGLVLAAQLARFGSIDTRIVEQRGGPLQLGQADGVACRTVETFQAFGLAEQLQREAYWVNETSFWSPDPGDPSRIVRSGRVQDVEDGISEFPHVIVNQARMHDFLLGAMRRATRRLVPDYGVACETLRRDGHPTHPLTVTLRRGDETLTVRARYVVGCDGARSRVREAIGRPLTGQAANHAWGVIDALAVTDFPDIRLKCAIQSRGGSIVLIPREGGYLVRLYVDLGEVTEENRAALRAMGSDEVAAEARRVFAPYSLEIKEVAWCSIYEVAQRVSDAFDDTAGRDEKAQPRVFIAGDACHTHSAKAGQGMNVSIQDAFNLGWKLAAVLEGRSHPGLLATYSAERQPIARELIEFDREWSAMLAAPQDGSDPDRTRRIEQYYVRQGRYTAGVAIRYPRSALTGPDTYQPLAPGLQLGTRLHSARVIRVADARQLQLGHVATADGRWRLYAFADHEERALSSLCEWLQGDPGSPLRRLTPAGADLDAVIDVRAVLQRPHREIDLGEMPALLHPAKGHLGLTDYEKAFTSPGELPGNIFDARGIDRKRGCVVIARPDQFVSAVLPLDAREALTQWLEQALFAAAVSTAAASPTPA